MKIKFWGVRGSLPRPRGEMLRYGGNTSCIEIRPKKGKLYIIDAGTGIVDLGDSLLKEGYDKPVKLLLTHLHWDHIQGFPFWAFAYVPGKVVDVLGSLNKKQHQQIKQGNKKLKNILHKQYSKCSGHTDNSTTNFTKYEFEKQQSYKVFPVPISTMGSILNFYDIHVDEEYVDEIEIKRMHLDHPQGSQALKIREDNLVVTTFFDNEHDSIYEDELGYPKEFGKRDLEKIAFLKGSNIAIMDSQYTPEKHDPIRFGKQGLSLKGWGHSTFESNLVIAKESGIETVIFTHLAIRSTDCMLDEYYVRSQNFANKIGYKGEVIMAREGLEFRF